MVTFSKSAIAKMSVACLAVGLSLSSCSKKDAQVAPEVGVGKAVSEANLKINGELSISSTNLPTGKGSPDGWYLFDCPEFGVSSCKYLFGNPTRQWKYPVPDLPSGAKTFITLRMDPSAGSGGVAMGEVSNLVLGKKYIVKYHLLAADTPGRPSPPKYPTANVNLSYDGSYFKSTPIDFTGKWNKWVPGSVTFVAEKDYYQFVLNTHLGSGYCAINLSIDSISEVKNSIADIK